MILISIFKYHCSISNRYEIMMMMMVMSSVNDDNTALRKQTIVKYVFTPGAVSDSSTLTRVFVLNVRTYL